MTDKNDIAAFANLYDGTDLFLVPENGSETLLNNDKNAGKAVIVCKELSDNDKELLSKILGALSVSEEEVVILKPEVLGSISFADLLHVTETTKYVIFGFTPSDLRLTVKYLPYQPIDMAGVHILFSDGLPELAKDQQKKKALWMALKDIFEING